MCTHLYFISFLKPELRKKTGVFMTSIFKNIVKINLENIQMPHRKKKRSVEIHLTFKMHAFSSLYQTKSGKVEHNIVCLIFSS